MLQTRQLEAAPASVTAVPVWAAASGNPHDLGIEWDAENRLTVVKQGGNTAASFSYDGKGRRATKTAGGVTTSYVYDGAEFLEERPSTGASKRYVYGPGIDRPLAQSIGGVTFYFLADHLGSIVQVTDSSDAPTLTREYDPWGNPLQGSTTGGYAFTGREWDVETNLYYYRARYYEPRVGRFISEDPIGGVGGDNYYSYGGGAPVRFGDPFGLRPYVDRYPSIDVAAIHALAEYWRRSQAEGVEYAGSIYRNRRGGGYSYIVGRPGTRTGSNNHWPMSAASGTRRSTGPPERGARPWPAGEQAKSLEGGDPDERPRAHGEALGHPGLDTLPFIDNVEDVKVQLAKEMDKQGLEIDVAKL